MSWKRAQFHAESMLANLGAGPKVKGRKDLRGRKLLLVDDEANPYRTMCFTIAAKIVKKRGGDVEIRAPKSGEVPHAEILGGPPEKPEPRTRTGAPGQGSGSPSATTAIRRAQRQGSHGEPRRPRRED